MVQFGLSIIVILFQKLTYLMKQICLNPVCGINLRPMYSKENSSQSSRIDNPLHLLREVNAKNFLKLNAQEG